MQFLNSFSHAIEHSKRVLFERGTFQKWILLGVIIFLESLASCGSSSTRTGADYTSDEDIGPQLDIILDGIMGQLSIFVMVSSIVAVAVLALLVLFQWIASRGTIMFIHALREDEILLGKLWTRSGPAGNSLFRFNVFILLATYALVVAILVTLLMMAIAAHQAGDAIVFMAMLPVLLVAAPFGLLLTFAGGLARNFVAPLMCLFDETVSEAWKRAYPILIANIPALLGFLVYRIVFGVVFGITSLVVGCLTFCIGFIPVVHHTIFAPFYVFDRCVSLYMLGSMGPDYALLPVAERDPMPQGPPLPPAE